MSDIKQLILYINSKKWHKFGHWKTSVLNDSLASFSVRTKYAHSILPFTIDEMLIINDDFYFDAYERIRVRDHYINKISKDITYLKKFYELLDIVSYEVLQELNRAETLDDFTDVIVKVMALGVGMHPLDEAIETYITENKIDPEILKYVYPVRKAYMIQEKIDLLEIKKKLCQGKNISKILEKHAETYGWMATINWLYDLYDAPHYEEELKKITCEEVETERGKLKNIHEAEKQIKKYLISKDDHHRELLGFLRHLLDAKMLNWDVIGIANFALRRVLKKDKMLSKLDYFKAVSLTANELRKLRKGELSYNDAKIFAEEREGNKISFYKEGETVVSPLSSNNLRLLTLYNKTKNEISEFKGTLAFRGKVQGHVQIIMEVTEVKDMKDRHILVCPMTNPDFMYAVNKASAIVTDEGGVLCHAAIIARELKKPCIIGTKIATQVLKDGDLVEVDADKGVVRILKKAEKNKPS